MKTLVIHPSDRTTDMLCLIYKNRDWTVCRDNGISDEELRELIKTHDRIIMLGHGTPYGLINSRRSGYIVNSSHVDLLKEKECISIWCKSDEFFSKYNIPGFHTGMIISEVDEEYYMLGYAPLNEEEILNNMLFFSRIVAECIDMSPIDMKKHILNKYNFKDEVTQYNRGNIIVI